MLADHRDQRQHSADELLCLGSLGIRDSTLALVAKVRFVDNRRPVYEGLVLDAEGNREQQGVSLPLVGQEEYELNALCESHLPLQHQMPNRRL